MRYAPNYFIKKYLKETVNKYTIRQLLLSVVRNLNFHASSPDAHFTPHCRLLRTPYDRKIILYNESIDGQHNSVLHILSIHPLFVSLDTFTRCVPIST